eukprot:tig00000764_g3983.t1
MPCFAEAGPAPPRRPHCAPTGACNPCCPRLHQAEAALGVRPPRPCQTPRRYALLPGVPMEEALKEVAATALCSRKRKAEETAAEGAAPAPATPPAPAPAPAATNATANAGAAAQLLALLQRDPSAIACHPSLQVIVASIEDDAAAA